MIKIGATEVDTITVEYGATQDITGEALAFLTAPAQHTYHDDNYPLIMENLNSSRIFPHGQRMAIISQRTKRSDEGGQAFALQAAAGVTLTGYAYGNYSSFSEDARDAISHGIQYLPQLRKIDGPTYGDDRSKWEESYIEDQERVELAATSQMDLYHNDFGDDIYGWLYCIDDYMGDIGNRSRIDAMHKTIHDYDDSLNPTNKRQVGEFCTGGYATTGSAALGYTYCSIFLSQRYYDNAARSVGDGDGNWRSRCIYNRETADGREISQLAVMEPSDYPRKGLPRLYPNTHRVNHSYPIHSGNCGLRSLAVRDFMHDAIVGLLSGNNSLMIFGWHDAGANETAGKTLADFHTYVDAVRNVLTEMTGNDMQQALLWGDRTRTMTIAQTSGQTHWTMICRPYSTTGMYSREYQRESYSDPMLTSGAMQYKGRRYIFAANSHPEESSLQFWTDNNTGTVYGDTIPCTSLTWQNSSNRTWNPPAVADYTIGIQVSGFPLDMTQLKVTEYLSGGDTVAVSDVTNQVSGGAISRTLAPLQSVVYIVDVAEGWRNPTL